MLNIHIDDDAIAALIGCNHFRMYVHVSKTKRICTIKKRRRRFLPTILYICVPLRHLIRRLIDRCILKVLYNHHQYSSRETIIPSLRPIINLFFPFFFFINIERESVRVEVRCHIESIPSLEYLVMGKPDCDGR
jgi:hypothetical protein